MRRGDRYGEAGGEKEREVDADTHRLFMSLDLWEGRREDRKGGREGGINVIQSSGFSYVAAYIYS